ncbi:MAG: hypothetical protein KAS11_03365 [Candidatus Aenigmarchaeota archaeon]|nr:hypothetical protein [Candidatus Aenigmarchaeota archaeon]
MNKYPFTIDYNADIDKDIDKHFKYAYDINHDFFMIDLPQFKIKIWYGRKGFNANFRFPSGSKYHANSGMKAEQPMDVMSPSILRKEMKYPTFSYAYLRMLAKHEMCHRFLYQKWGKVFYPCWINEGMSCLVAEQESFLDKSKDKIMPVAKIHYLRDWYRYNNYWQAYSMTKYLIEKYGRKNMDELFSILKEKESYKVFSEKFKKIYSITPEEFEKGWFNHIS